MLYFFPGVKATAGAREAASALGMGHVFEDQAKVACSEGPDGATGAIVSPFGVPAVYDAARQEWQNCGGDVWIGKAGPVTPDMLLRAAHVNQPGLWGYHPVKLCDGHEWMIPIARAFPVGTALPQTFGYGPEGEERQVVEPRFAQLSRDAQDLYDDWDRALGLSRTEAEAFAICVRALQVNYRIGERETRYLRLLNTQNMGQVLRAIFDEPTIEAAATQLVQKKTELAESHSAT